MALWCPLFLLLLLQTVRIKSLSSWPDGSYGLLKPVTGCPKEWTDKDWTSDKGFIYQDTVDKKPSNNRSYVLHIEGYVGPSFVMRYFCLKKDDGGKSSKQWPEGQYCIYRSGQTVAGMLWGRIRMYDENKGTTAFTGNTAWTRYWYTNLYFSCKKSGKKKIPIELPITKPFYLLPYGSRDCQQVKWMVATSEWIKYHTRNYKGSRNYQKGGTVPHHELGSVTNKGITMYYCYYQSCSYNLTEKKSAFQSPGFPGKYPDGQLCSWRIMVPAYHTVHVHFTNFSLPEDDDILRIYKRVDGTFKLNNTFQGQVREPIAITSKSDLDFVFETDEARTSTGFRAEYNISETTTTENPPTAGQQTTKPSTTNPSTTNPSTTNPSTTKPSTTKPPQTTKPNPRTKKPKTVKPQTTAHPTTQMMLTKTECYMIYNRTVESLRDSRVFGQDRNWTILVMVMPIVGCVLIIVLVVDIVYRCRYKNNKTKSKIRSSRYPRSSDRLAVNMTYERGDIILNHPTPTDTTAENATPDTVDDKPLSPDELPDYEDVDYTQLNEMKPPNMETRYPECHALDPNGHDAPEVFYHVLEPPTDLNRPTYQNLSELNHYTLNPLYDSSAQNPSPLDEGDDSHA